MQTARFQNNYTEKGFMGDPLLAGRGWGNGGLIVDLWNRHYGEINNCFTKFSIFYIFI